MISITDLCVVGLEIKLNKLVSERERERERERESLCIFVSKIENRKSIFFFG